MIELTMAAGYVLSLGNGKYINSVYNKETEIMSYFIVSGLDNVNMFKKLSQAREAKDDLKKAGMQVQILKLTLERIEDK